MRPTVLEALHLRKEYPAPGGALTVLSSVELSLLPGSSASIIGPSGSGKSTLLYILGALEPPTSGKLTLGGVDPYSLDGKSLAEFRNREIGFVFQDHHLLPQCSVLENVLIPSIVSRAAAEDADARARWLIERVGLRERAHHRPAELSGGEKQRAALARALVLKPRLLLCDEPTGNLDGAATDAVASLLLDLHRAENTILVVVTHNLELAARFSMRFRLHQGRLMGL